MAKGLRSGVKKANKSRLRARVFSGVEDARTERLSAKLVELAARPRSAQHDDAEMDTGESESQDRSNSTTEKTHLDDMDLDDDSMKASGKRRKGKGSGRVQKPRRRKARNSMTFPVYKKTKATPTARHKKQAT